MRNYIYLVGCATTRECYCFDPAWDTKVNAHPQQLYSFPVISLYLPLREYQSSPARCYLLLVPPSPYLPAPCTALSLSTCSLYRPLLIYLLLVPLRASPPTPSATR